ncbi:YALI0C11275p [Yarrowia lipolytica CLIB122]|uniref:YALI0C11275p n=2 Tax=Yarrowia lipolytica TaxID=4952 RepID=Q6CC97_YARLI|nr:YALI0C11275p [Yarrowia lipolytica CLIB122]AOW02687.1 hypothetical protein YALI1_C15745g [Yarrowia lipolytica]KAJ8053333.1 hypothetical protein LXG23DRAFT_49582 [Yarrowia lipolytica]RMI95384.1 hypothetical protein BD777DRAFT_143466 [Yarrowia lipolytica]CAG82025.2 YALI0C11275p [Yarrowia lipolytica CLIB122]|eukprot:XP_501715.2 YALI0C11275p [Yarrowia lipolytica CLIB122]
MMYYAAFLLFFFFFVAGAVSGDGTFLLGSIDHAKYSGKISYDTAPYPSTGAVINLDTITVNVTDVSFDESALLDSGLIVIAISDPQFKSRARFFLTAIQMSVSSSTLGTIQSFLTNLRSFCPSLTSLEPPPTLSACLLFRTWQYLGQHRPAVSACKLVPEKKTPTQPSIWITRKLDWS